MVAYNRRSHALVRALVLMIAGLVALAVAPGIARAGEYRLPQTRIDAVVQPDGSLSVAEARAFDLEDDINGVYWEIPIAENAQGREVALAVDAVSVAEVADGAVGEARSFSPARGAGSGASGVYTVARDADGFTLKVFAPHEDGDQMVVTVWYTLDGAVMAWADTAELYWQFVGSAWAEDSEDVQLTVSFAGAAASGEAPRIGSGDANLRAWGHGPVEGTVRLNAETPSVTFAAPTVRSGQFAEARIAFPTSWVPGLPASGESRLDTVLSEEEAWAEQANAAREQARRVLAVGTVAQIALPAILLAAVVVLRFTRFKSPKPVFQETYFRDVPSADHPAVLSAFMAGGAIENRAFVATLMKLTDDRVIELVQASREQEGLFGLGAKEIDEYRVRLVDRARATDPIDRAALDLYFGPDAADGAETAFDKLKISAEDGAKDTGERLDAFKAEVSAQLKACALTSAVPAWFTGGAGALAAALGVASLLFVLAVDGAAVVPFIVSAVLIVAAAVLALTAKAYNQEAVELHERCAALKRWLEDFTNLDEAVPGDLILWNKLLVMAVAFGVSDEVLRQLADAAPFDARDDEVFDTYDRYNAVYWWCRPHGHLASPAHELNDAYQATVGELMSSSRSSAGGFGGGFSGGGGGGVGGGGGGTF